MRIVQIDKKTWRVIDQGKTVYVGKLEACENYVKLKAIRK